MKISWKQIPYFFSMVFLEQNLYFLFSHEIKKCILFLPSFHQQKFCENFIFHLLKKFRESIACFIYYFLSYLLWKQRIFLSRLMNCDQNWSILISRNFLFWRIFFLWSSRILLKTSTGKSLARISKSHLSMVNMGIKWFEIVLPSILDNF